MTKRKDRLKALFTGEADQAAAKPQSVSMPAAKPAGSAGVNPDDKAPPPSPSPAVRPRSASGAVKAMGLSLGQMADDLKKNTGDKIVRLDPAKIEASPIADRLTSDAHLDDGFEALKESLKLHGQQVPVLVRPHPDAAKREAGWYQAAYGHRRIRAARDLGLEIQALVKQLSDTALVLAQGKENAERRDLSFIERAFFARNLIDAGYERSTIQEALSLHKAEMTRLLQVADRVPLRIARAVGPAPKIGRPRWHALGELLDSEAAEVIAADEITSDAFRAVDSDQRFQRLYARLAQRKPAKPKVRKVKTRKGTALAELKGSVLTISKDAPEPFAAYLADRLPELLEEFERNTAETGKTSG
ncbi:chromosome partitioning protein, ParB family [Roseibium denhamense]|uniref:Chromosome partitioning protein, ParB family n=2 Tax=Roseibium denhamense TaxID=76305 RepID=A0ABY1PNJ3_9HYPH|nr:plasmid partitioning protein RepB [Roseibium denhamense]SMP37426.1 chromosome partitioning protein, ParB family [Roseibium denhamense]